MANKRSADPATRVEEIPAQFSVRTPPVSADRIAKGLGAQLRFSPLDEELSGMIYVSGTPSSLGSIRYTNLSRHTQDAYLLQVSQFARHFAKSPALLGPEDIRAYQVYLTNEKNLAPRSVHVTVAALRFLYRITLGRDWDFDQVIPCPKAPKTLAVILSPEEVLHVLSCIESLKHQAILTTCYAAGLRISEATRLKPIGAPCDPQGYGCFPAPLLENRYRQAPWMPPAAGCIGCRNSPSR